ncbi:MAG: hypothetical protein JSW50_06695, partial [Candidatus Latescibacterota bacterium]
MNEVEKRELCLKRGYGSMFEYCVNHLEYSRSAAGRRIQTARCIKRFPELRAALRNNAMNLTTVGLIAPVITEANKKTLLIRVQGKPQDKVEAIVAGYRPPVAFRDRVKPVRVAVPTKSNDHSPTWLDLGSIQSRSGIPVKTSESTQHITSERSTPGDSPHQTRQNHYTIKKQLLIQFLANEEFMAKYRKARSLLSNKLKDASFENVFEAVLDEFIDRHCPVKKNERRAKRRESATKPSRSGTRSLEIKEQPNRQLAKTKSRGGTDIMLTSRIRNRPRGRRR